MLLDLATRTLNENVIERLTVPSPIVYLTKDHRRCDTPHQDDGSAMHRDEPVLDLTKADTAALLLADTEHRSRDREVTN